MVILQNLKYQKPFLPGLVLYINSYYSNYKCCIMLQITDMELVKQNSSIVIASEVDGIIM